MRRIRSLLHTGAALFTMHLINTFAQKCRVTVRKPLSTNIGWPSLTSNPTQSLCTKLQSLAPSDSRRARFSKCMHLLQPLDSDNPASCRLEACLRPVRAPGPRGSCFSDIQSCFSGNEAGILNGRGGKGPGGLTPQRLERHRGSAIVWPSLIYLCR